MSEITIWGIHAGRSGEADGLFREKKFIALGWSKIGNPKNLQADRDAFKDAVATSYPDKNPDAIPGDAGLLYRFVHEMKPGDLVVYPSKRDIRLLSLSHTYFPAWATAREFRRRGPMAELTSLHTRTSSVSSRRS